MSSNSASFKTYLSDLEQGHSLSEDQAEAAFDLVLEGDATPSQMGAFLMGLRIKGETVEEITGAVKVMRAKSTKIQAPHGAMDIVGTGGDSSGTYNISTASALVVAGAGVPVAKHGNRAASSKTGSADVLTALGIDLDADFSKIEQSIAAANIGFMMAQRHHKAMRNVGPTRVELGIRTLFNILGPLSNPANVKRLLVGVYDPTRLEQMAEVLGKLGAERAWVVHGADGLDELSTTGVSKVAAYENGAVRTFKITPEEAGLPRVTLDKLQGGDPDQNAAAIRDLLEGAPSAFRDAVLLNAGAALVIADKAETLSEGARLAAASIDTGKAKQALASMLALTGLNPETERTGD